MIKKETIQAIRLKICEKILPEGAWIVTKKTTPHMQPKPANNKQKGGGCKREVTHITQDKYGLFRVVKCIQNHTLNFGAYTTRRRAETVRDYLIFKNWDTQYIPKNWTGCGKNKPDTMYFELKPVMYTDKEYQEYLKQNGGE